MTLTITADYHLAGWHRAPPIRELEHVADCPACRAEITDTGAIYTADPDITLYLATCQLCGWLGYRTRPPADWFNSYYAHDWDAAGAAAAKAEALKYHTLPLHPIAAAITRHLPAGATILDYGCGFGAAIHQLSRARYRAHGVEPSDHRRLTAQAHGLDVFASLAELPQTDQYDAVTTHHVLEHLPTPAALALLLTRRLKPNGLIYCSVPNQHSEPPAGIALFLPHLHSFTRSAIRTLWADAAALAGHGLAVIHSDPSPWNIEEIYRLIPAGDPVPQPDPPTDWTATHRRHLDRLTHAAGFGPLLCWSGQLPLATWRTQADWPELAKSHALSRAVFARRTAPRSNLWHMTTPTLYVK